MTFVTCLGLPVVFVYQAWTYWVFRKRLHVDHPRGSRRYRTG